MSDEGWEQRMAERAAIRRAEREAEERAAQVADWERQSQASGHWPDDLTLGWAMTWDWTWGCACIGGRNCCMKREEQSKRLKRAAHIVARLLADVAAREDR
jgi:hypothetical protein